MNRCTDDTNTEENSTRASSEQKARDEKKIRMNRKKRRKEFIEGVK